MITFNFLADCVESEPMDEEEAEEAVTEVLDDIEKMGFSGDIAENFNSLTEDQLA